MANDTEKAEAKETAPAKELTLRRVYALPSEMVDRITDFQKEKGFTSEVEAVRRLLEEALQNRDILEDVIHRFLAKLRSLRLASEVAKEVLVGHPLIAGLRFEKRAVTFETRDMWKVTISDNGHIDIEDDDQNTKYWHANKDDRFGNGWISSMRPKVEAPAFDDDIPF